jgi:2-polyprenyl-3-methyl-5-hydroxy-6-metoxy-1,4-benzoquinol methylase
VDTSLWDAIAKVERRHWWFRGRREIVARVLEARLPAGASVLDVGCGTGFVLEGLAERFHVTGLEPDASVRARAHPSIAGRLLPGASDDLSALNGRSFDAVLMLDVLEHVDDDVVALRHVKDVLAPDGLLLATVPANPKLWSQHDVLNQHRRRYTKEILAERLRAASYEVLHLTHINSRLYPLAWVHRRVARETMAALMVPREPLNWIFGRVFAGEAGTRLPTYQRGLSLLVLAKPA